MKKDTRLAPKLDALLETLPHRFGDASLLERALTHRSWAHEQVGPGEEEQARRLHNEALEFLGDSVLGLVMAEHLFRSYPEASEGDLSRMKHRLVSAETLAGASKRLRLGEFLRVGYGEEKTGGRRKRALLADAFEAVLAAVYLDGGLDAARDFVLSSLEPELDESDPEAVAAADYKTMLQEVLQADGRDAPRYEVVETAGPPHKRTFRVEVTWGDSQAARAEGRTIKAAEIEAARLALEELKQSDTPPHTATDAE